MSRSNLDLRFNRITKHGRRVYLTDYAKGRNVGEKSYQGFIKCKLVHHHSYSLVIPDQVYLEIGDEVLWYQPLYYGASLILNHEKYGQCNLSIDISHCVVLNVEFKDKDVIYRLDDCSIVYRCTVNAPEFLHRYATGKAKLTKQGPYIQLFHHTSKRAKAAIPSHKQEGKSSNSH